MIIDKIALIEIINGQILSTKSKGKNRYYLPGGKRERGESDEETLIREIKEELSVDIVPGSYRYIGTFEAQSDGMEEGIRVKMTCYSAKFTGTPRPSSEIEKIIWLNYKDINVVSAVDEKIFSYLKAIGELR